MRKNNLKNSKKPLTSAEKYDIILKSLKTMKSYHILKTAGGIRRKSCRGKIAVHYKCMPFPVI